MDAVGSFVAKKAFESKVDSLTKDVTSVFGFNGEDSSEGSGNNRRSATALAEQRAAEEKRKRELEEAHLKRKEQSRAKANALREKYGLPTDNPPARGASQTTPYRGSSSPDGFSRTTQCCILC